MKVTPIQKTLIGIRKVTSNPKAAAFAQNTVCAIAVETTLKAMGRPAFIYYDKHANGRSKKYAATKEFLYQSFCLGLYLSLINKFKGVAYNILSGHLAKKDPENKRKIDLFNTEQDKIKAAPKEKKASMEKALHKLIQKNPDYKFGKGVKELSSIGATVFILALCAPILSQIILHPVMNLIFKKDKNKAAVQPKTQPAPVRINAPAGKKIKASEKTEKQSQQPFDEDILISTLGN